MYRPKELYWMLSNHETRERMRCKLVENLQFDSHLEASRLRDYSGYTNYEAVVEVANDVADSGTHLEEKKKFLDESGLMESENLTNKLKINIEAINTELNEDTIADEEFQNQQQQLQNNQSDTNRSEMKGEDTKSLPEPSTTTSEISSIKSNNAKTSSNVNLSETHSNANLIKNPQQEYYEAFLQLEEKEKLIIRSECELITVTRVIKGRFELTNKYIYFFDTYSSFYFENQSSFNDSNLENAPYVNGANASLTNGHSINQTSFSANPNYNIGFSCHDFDILNDFKISLTQLKEVQLRRYNLRRSALEFFVINGSNFFINFNKNVSFPFFIILN